jgi:hypothetical protein
MRASLLRKILMPAYMTALPLAFCTTFAEARGVGITHQSQIRTTTPAEHPATSPTSPSAMSLHQKGEAAERAAIQDDAGNHRR